MTEWLVEPATLEDYPWIAALWRQHQDVMGPGLEHMWRSYIRGIRQPIAQRETHVDVVPPGMGFQAYQRRADGDYASYRIAVAVKRQGVARALRQHLVVTLGDKRMYAIIKASNTVSIIVHERFGFVRHGEGVDARTGEKLLMYYAKGEHK